MIWFGHLFDISRASGLSCIACFFRFLLTPGFMSVLICCFIVELHLVHFLLRVEFSMHLDILEICNDTLGILDLVPVPLSEMNGLP